ncbi:hypothetical protein Lesp02_22110 [Lentzea sp. NBRC 105346]|nr:hypothetical protein [Lentzea sp. NBRC 105346]GLZ30021.1 hypothetical protein Lesp02_22110 [Lentzea sp. NBRC 105346]
MSVALTSENTLKIGQMTDDNADTGRGATVRSLSERLSKVGAMTGYVTD